jgi:hypothetical protein
MAMDVNTSDGNHVQLFRTHSGLNQQFTLENANTPDNRGRPTYYLISRQNGMALEVVNGSSANGTRVRVAAKANVTQQKFRIILNSANGSFGISPLSSQSEPTEKFLRARNGATGLGTVIELFDNNSSATHQRWLLRRMPIGISPASRTLSLGQTFTPTVNNPHVTGESIIWESLTPSVATVDRNTGRVTAVSPGTATIRARLLSGPAGTMTVTVTNVREHNIRIRHDTASLTLVSASNMTSSLTTATNGIFNNFEIRFNLNGSPTSATVLDGSGSICNLNNCNVHGTGVAHRRADLLLEDEKDANIHTLRIVGTRLCGLDRGVRVPVAGFANVLGRESVATVFPTGFRFSEIIQHELTHNLGVQNHCTNRCIMNGNNIALNTWCSPCATLVRQNK